MNQRFSQHVWWLDRVPRDAEGGGLDPVAARRDNRAGHPVVPSRRATVRPSQAEGEENCDGDIAVERILGQYERAASPRRPVRGDQPEPSFLTPGTFASERARSPLRPRGWERWPVDMKPCISEISVVKTVDIAMSPL
jgi:hypothetical protein